MWNASVREHDVVQNVSSGFPIPHGLDRVHLDTHLPRQDGVGLESVKEDMRKKKPAIPGNPNNRW